jgi:hypothetical protein
VAARQQKKNQAFLKMNLKIPDIAFTVQHAVPNMIEIIQYACTLLLKFLWFIECVLLFRGQ